MEVCLQGRVIIKKNNSWLKITCSVKRSASIWIGWYMSDKPLQKSNLYTLDSIQLIWELKEEKSEKENRGRKSGRSESKRKGGNIRGTEKPHDIGMEIPGLYCKKLANQIWGFEDSTYWDASEKLSILGTLFKPLYFQDLVSYSS